ncbi:hypothetical protein [Streptococcus agalactiae]|nr:hypothetical protein [Streptococcus agalactiae]
MHIETVIDFKELGKRWRVGGRSKGGSGEALGGVVGGGNEVDVCLSLG